MSHTPGPWKCHDYETVDGMRYTIDAGDYQVCEGWLDMGPLQDQAVANARLIASAPEMYEALAGILAVAGFPVSGKENFWAAIDRAKQALAKAEGK
jgi:hypothetical protein